MASSKWPWHDENSFVDQSTPDTKHAWLQAQPVTLAEIKNLQQEQVQKDQAAAEVKVQVETKAQVEQVHGSITAARYKMLYGFVDELLNICDQQLSSHVSNMLSQHGEAVFAQKDNVWGQAHSSYIMSVPASISTKELPEKDKVWKDCILESSISFILCWP